MLRQRHEERGLLLGTTLLALALLVLNFTIRKQGEFFCNSNYGFGLFEPKPFFLFLGVVALAAAWWLSIHLSKYADKIIFSILLVGGIANVLERLFYGCIADYITLPFIGSQINIPDILITAAVGFFLFRRTAKKSL
jgi:lipoprotein signal peptidase